MGERIKFKDSKAPPGMQPWVRQIESVAQALQSYADRTSNTSGNAKTAGDGTMSFLQGQVAKLEGVVEDVVEQQGLLAQQQAALAAQQTALSAAQTSLQNAQTDIVNQQNYINSLQPISAASAAGLTSVSQGSWAGNAYRPTVTIATSSTRIKITVGATLLGALGVYSISGGMTVSRDSRVSGIEAINALSNYDTSSGVGAEKSFYVNVPRGVLLSVAAEFFGQIPDAKVGYPTIAVQNVG